MNTVSNCSLNLYLFIYILMQLSNFIMYISLCSKLWLIQKFTTDQNADCQWSIQPQMGHLYHHHITHTHTHTHTHTSTSTTNTTIPKFMGHCGRGEKMFATGRGWWTFSGLDRALPLGTHTAVVACKKALYKTKTVNILSWGEKGFKTSSHNWGSMDH